MSTQFKALLDFAFQLAQQAADIARKNAGEHLVSVKADGTLVTRSDEELDRYLTTAIAASYPDHAILSEEQSAVYNSRAEFTWVVDPVDGTTNFARGLPIWGVSIGLLQHGAPIVGVITFPLLHEVFSAARGGGARRNQQTIHSDSHASVDDKHLMTRCTRTDKRYNVRTPLKSRLLGSAAYHLCKIADGSVLAGIEATTKVWDIAAAAVILSEAGAVLEGAADHRPIFPLAPVDCDYSQFALPLLAAGNQAVLQQLRDSVSSK